MSENFVENYISTCLLAGKTSIVDICAAARAEIDEIEEDLKKMEERRTRQSNLRALLRQMGMDTVKREKVVSSIINTSRPFAELDPYLQETCVKICNFIDKMDRETTTNRELMDSVASPEENKAVLISIKWLFENGIISRNDSLTREIKKGANWSSRPQAKV